MKWVFALREKVKIAFVLTLLAVMIILFNVLMKTNVSGLEESMKSIYSDRLVAGATISAIIEKTYENHFLVEEHIQTNKVELYNKLEEGIKQNNEQVDSLLKKFKKTQLVEQEKEALKEFEQTNLAYRSFQKELLIFSRSGEKKIIYDQYLQKGNKLFHQVLAPAHQLSSIQTSEGETIYRASQSKFYIMKVISTLEAALVIIILTVTCALLKASNLVLHKQQKFWLN